METISQDRLQYPIGKFEFNESADERVINSWITDMEQLPLDLKLAVKGLSDIQLNTPYRDGGWTVRQVVHHVADSHMNAYTRIKLALTEDIPAIKPYLEKKWAELNDSTTLSVDISIAIIEPLHARMVYTLKNIKANDYDRIVYHPESRKQMSVKFLLSLYAWHGKHHVKHITSLRERSKW